MLVIIIHCFLGTGKRHLSSILEKPSIEGRANGSSDDIMPRRNQRIHIAFNCSAIWSLAVSAFQHLYNVF